MNEVWKTIPDFEDYMVSNMGNVKSKRKILNPFINAHGYCIVSLHNKNGKKQRRVHQLVALCFLDYTFENHSLVIDHVNGIKTDNNLSNLQLVTQRENKTRSSKNIKTGAFALKNSNKYISCIYINGVNKYLGIFNTEKEASDYYEKALKEFNDTGTVTVFKKSIFYSNTKGITYCKRTNKWIAKVKKTHIGRFKTEDEAIQAIQQITNT
jgi:hypothetical protein